MYWITDTDQGKKGSLDYDIDFFLCYMELATAHVCEKYFKNSLEGMNH